MAYVKHRIFQIVGAIVVLAYFVTAVLQSPSSSAAVAFLFLPFVVIFGVFAGDTVKYFLDLALKKRAHSMQKTLLIVAVLAFIGVRYFVKQSPGDKTVSEVIAKITSSEQIDSLLETHLYDLSFMQRIAQHPLLTPQQMEKVANLERPDFAGDAEYSLYQTNVWAQLAKREDVPESIIHTLAAKKSPDHFLILALLKSPVLSCDEMRAFLPQKNEVLSDAIQRAMNGRGCD